ncbi:hypothetical protein A2U01_0100836 [Trifolium medium]|uniref:Uncharacterized protein n=1 Tax=Trifolium medium TaxID=97028 RepID=A0A392UXW8_9FABA|nr:hypothetical protein [Trifolium medium]
MLAGPAIIRLAESKYRINYVWCVTDGLPPHRGGVIIRRVSQCIGVELFDPGDVAVSGKKEISGKSMLLS